MATCYGSLESKLDSDSLDILSTYLPRNVILKDGTPCLLDHLDITNSNLLSQALTLFNDMIREGLSWPFDNEFSEEEFVSYFCGHAAFWIENQKEDQNDEDQSGKLVGMYYIKPNFPGRCSKTCNGGFLVHPEYRGKGAAKIMVLLLFFIQFYCFQFTFFLSTKKLKQNTHNFGIILLIIRGDSSYEQLEILSLRIACSTLFLRRMRPLLECGDL